MKLTAQLKIPVYNDGYGKYEGKVHPGNLTLHNVSGCRIMCLVKLLSDILMRTNMDLMNLFRPFNDERFSLMARNGIQEWDIGADLNCI